RISARMNAIRDMGNLGPHGEVVEPQDAMRVLEDLCEVLEWYEQRYAASNKDAAESVGKPPVSRGGSRETRPEDEPDERLSADLLREILGSTRVAEAPPDLEQARNAGEAGVEQKVKKIATTARHGLELEHVLEVAGEAIRHGAGIYNHS